MTGCDNKVESRWRSSVMTISAMTLVAVVVASRSTLRHVYRSFFSRSMPQCGLTRESVSNVQAVSHEHLSKTGRAPAPEPHVFEWHCEPAFVPREQDMIPAGQRLNPRVHVAEFSQWIFRIPGRKDLVNWYLNP